MYRLIFHNEFMTRSKEAAEAAVLSKQIFLPNVPPDRIALRSTLNEDQRQLLLTYHREKVERMKADGQDSQQFTLLMPLAFLGDDWGRDQLTQRFVQEGDGSSTTFWLDFLADPKTLPAIG